MRSLAVPGDLGRQEVAWGLVTRLQRVKSEKRTKWDRKAGESVVKPPGGEGGLRACVQSHPGGVEDFFLREGSCLRREETVRKSHQAPSPTRPTCSHQSLGHRAMALTTYEVSVTFVSRPTIKYRP